MVKITDYKWEGNWLFFRIKTRCGECDLSTSILKDMMKKEFNGKNVQLDIKPWLNNWYKPILFGGWHAPIVMINNKIFSQGIVPNRKNLAEFVFEELNREKGK